MPADPGFGGALGLGLGMTAVIYRRAGKMVGRLLASNRLGQGPITIKRVTGEDWIDPEQLWLGKTETTITETVDQIGTGKNEYRTGEAVIGVDLALMIVPPRTLTVQVGDTVERDGARLGTVVRVEAFPPTGTPVYVNLFINR